ncbi:FAD-dependent monooxygenase [Streptomyces niveus]|uniref:FAD-dependent monooxygenase n=1 Tax=Streptomyces niveus TaxID=193462 RepID=UPI0036D3C89C
MFPVPGWVWFWPGDGVGVVGGAGAGVVVVGGGPVGLLVACELAAFGVRVLVVEARGSVSRRPRATTLHARSVQSLVRRGYLDGAAGVGAGGGNGGFHFAGMPGLTISVPVGEPVAVLKCEQEVLERSLEERARAAGVVVLRGHRVSGVCEVARGVRVSAVGPGGRAVEWVAEYVVGADGARGVVRELAGFDSRSYPATVSAMAGDARLEEPGALVAGWHRTPRGWVVVKDVAGGGVRLRTLNCEGAPGARGAPLSLEEFRGEVSRIVGREVGMGSPRWLSRFSDFSRLACCYRKGRVLLAGDAAHVHFPIGGQGLSTGVLDALNLGWKLALTVRGSAGEGLLDTYDRERRPAAQRVIDHTRAQLALMRPDAQLDPLRALFGELLAAAPEGGVLASMVSGQDTVLPARGADSSPWEGSFLANVPLVTGEGRTDVIGLLAAGRPLLLLLGAGTGAGAGAYEAQARGWAGVLRVVRAEPVPGLPYEAVLVRPDGYIGWAAGGGGLAPALRAYFGEGEGAEVRDAPSGAVS